MRPGPSRGGSPVREVAERPYVVAIDPGGNTGLAWMIDGTDFGSYVQGGGRFGFVDAFCASIEKFATPTVVVVESFIITSATARKTAQPDPYLIYGWLELWCHRHGISFHSQTPAQAKGFGTDAKLKHLGWYSAGNGGHDNDAARHLLTYLAVHVKDPSVLAKLKDFQ